MGQKETSAQIEKLSIEIKNSQLKIDSQSKDLITLLQQTQDQTLKISEEAIAKKEQAMKIYSLQSCIKEQKESFERELERVKGSKDTEMTNLKISASKDAFKDRQGFTKSLAEMKEGWKKEIVEKNAVIKGIEEKCIGIEAVMAGLKVNWNNEAKKIDENWKIRVEKLNENVKALESALIVKDGENEKLNDAIKSLNNDLGLKDDKISGFDKELNNAGLKIKELQDLVSEFEIKSKVDVNLMDSQKKGIEDELKRLETSQQKLLIENDKSLNYLIQSLQLSEKIPLEQTYEIKFSSLEWAIKEKLQSFKTTNEEKTTQIFNINLEKTGLETKLTKLTQELQEISTTSKSTSTEITKETASLNTQLQNERAKFEKDRQAYTDKIYKLEQQLETGMEEYKSKLDEKSALVELLGGEKIELALKAQELEIRMEQIVRVAKEVEDAKLDEFKSFTENIGALEDSLELKLVEYQRLLDEKCKVVEDLKLERQYLGFKNQEVEASLLIMKNTIDALRFEATENIKKFRNESTANIQIKNDYESKIQILQTNAETKFIDHNTQLEAKCAIIDSLSTEKLQLSVSSKEIQFNLDHFQQRALKSENLVTELEQKLSLEIKNGLKNIEVQKVLYEEKIRLIESKFGQDFEKIKSLMDQQHLTFESKISALEITIQEKLVEFINQLGLKNSEIDLLKSEKLSLKLSIKEFSSDLESLTQKTKNYIAEIEKLKSTIESITFKHIEEMLEKKTSYDQKLMAIETQSNEKFENEVLKRETESDVQKQEFSKKINDLEEKVHAKLIDFVTQIQQKSCQIDALNLEKHTLGLDKKVLETNLDSYMQKYTQSEQMLQQTKERLDFTIKQAKESYESLVKINKEKTDSLLEDHLSLVENQLVDFESKNLQLEKTFQEKLINYCKKVEEKTTEIEEVMQQNMQLSSKSQRMQSKIDELGGKLAITERALKRGSEKYKNDFEEKQSELWRQRDDFLGKIEKIEREKVEKINSLSNQNDQSIKIQKVKFDAKISEIEKEMHSKLQGYLTDMEEKGECLNKLSNEKLKLSLENQELKLKLGLQITKFTDLEKLLSEFRQSHDTEITSKESQLKSLTSLFNTEKTELLQKQKTTILDLSTQIETQRQGYEQKITDLFTLKNSLLAQINTLMSDQSRANLKIQKERMKETLDAQQRFLEQKHKFENEVKGLEGVVQKQRREISDFNLVVGRCLKRVNRVSQRDVSLTPPASPVKENFEL